MSVSTCSAPLDRRGLKNWGGHMRRHLAFGGAARPELNRSVSSVACLVFVVLLGLAFWAGAVWLAQALVRMSQTGF
jgi:hypothetical protein